MDPTDVHNNEQKWKFFLSSIDTGTFKCLPTNNIKITTKRNIECLATKFAGKLLQKKGGSAVLTGTQDILHRFQYLEVASDNSDVIEMSAQGAYAMFDEIYYTDGTLSQIEIPADDIAHVSADVDIIRNRKRDTHTPSKKSDIDKSCSKWNISNLAEYFSFDDCVTKIEMPIWRSCHPGEIYEMVENDISRRLQIVRGIDLKGIQWDSYSKLLRQLISTTTTETGSRLVLDALLIPLCSALDLQLEVDKNIDCNFLPNCRFDYCIRKGEHIIGCIEAKSVKSLSDTSIAQAVVQLMILQTTLLRTETLEVDISEFPVFAIVTDGHRFIYMQLKGSSLGFEHNGGKVRIREVGQECDFKDILQHIRFLVEEAVGHPFYAHFFSAPKDYQTVWC